MDLRLIRLGATSGRAKKDTLEKIAMPICARPDHLVLLASSLADSAPYNDALLPLLGFEKLKDHYWRSPHAFMIQLLEARPGTRP